MSWMLSSLVPELRRRAGIEGLFVFGWAGSLGLILIFFIALFFAFGFWWPYWRAADMDTWMVYEAFLFNDGLDQTYFAHPGYLTILLLGLWFDLLHAAGLLSVHALFELPPVSDIAASASAWMRATQAARLLSLGASERLGVREVGEGIRVASVRDPNGAEIGIIENPHFELTSITGAAGPGR